MIDCVMFTKSQTCCFANFLVSICLYYVEHGSFATKFCKHSGVCTDVWFSHNICTAKK